MANTFWPISLCPKAFSLELKPDLRSASAPFGGSDEVIDLQSDSWEVTATIDSRANMSAGLLEAFSNFLAGGINTVDVCHFARPVPRGTVGRMFPVYGLILDAAKGASSVVIATTPGATLLAGDIIRVSGLLLMCQSDCFADPQGVMQVLLVNRLRHAIYGLQRASSASFLDYDGRIKTVAENIPRFVRDPGVNLYNGPANLVAESGNYGSNHILKSGSLNPFGFVPGDTLTLSADVYQDQQSMSDGSGRVSMLYLWTSRANGGWATSTNISTQSLSSIRMNSSQLTLPSDADMHSIGVGVYHIGGNETRLGAVHADRIQVQRGPATEYEPCNIHLLVEESGSNLAPHASDLASWNDNGGLTVTSNAMMAPDGTMTADVTGAGHTKFVTIPNLANGTYTVSHFVHPAPSVGQVWLYMDTGVTPTPSICRFNLSTLAIDYLFGQAISGSIDRLADGWFRMQMQVQVTEGTVNIHCYPITDDEHGWWHLQFEPGYKASSPMISPRAADVCTIIEWDRPTIKMRLLNDTSMVYNQNMSQPVSMTFEEVIDG